MKKSPVVLRREGFLEEAGEEWAFKDELKFARQQEGNFWPSKLWKPRHTRRERVWGLVWPSLGEPGAGGWKVNRRGGEAAEAVRWLQGLAPLATGSPRRVQSRWCPLSL